MNTKNKLFRHPKPPPKTKNAKYHKISWVFRTIRLQILKGAFFFMCAFPP